MVYLDNAATTRVCPEAAEAAVHMMTECFGNPSTTYKLGREAKAAVDKARGQIAKALGCQPDEVYFTSCGSEGDNWALISGARYMRRRGKHIISSAVEHDAVRKSLDFLEKEGYEITRLQPDGTGAIPLEAVRAALRPDTILVSLMMVNNETGAVMPIPEMIRATRRKSPLALFHTDAVQGFFKLPFKAKTLGADMISVSGHKIHASKGVGALYIRPGLPLPPLILGGGQESNYRSGTENLPGICGFGAACAEQLPRLSADIAHMKQLRDLCRETLSDVPGLVFLGKQDAPHIVNLSLPGLRSQGIINCLQDHDIYVSAGSACSRGHRSHVLEAMHLPPAVIDGSIRVSFCPENTAEDVAALHEALLDAVRVLKG